jgi:hypothetical protein
MLQFKTRLVVILTAISAAAPAQWLTIPTPGIPRTPDGKPNLSAPAPKTADGKPDLSGIWSPDTSRLFNIASGLKPGEVPFQPWAEELFKSRADGARGKDDPAAYCIPGMPKLNTIPYPFKTIQTPGLFLILYEGFTVYRQIFTDGRALPKDPQPAWLGYSVGRWDGDTLVVDTIGINEKTWLDNDGRPHSDALHLTERFRRKDFGHMDIQITIDDPKVYTKPWTITESPRLLPDTELLEYICSENNKDIDHLTGK